MRGVAWHDLVGLAGVAAILLAYALLQAGRLAASRPLYSALNLAGALAIVASLTVDWNLPAFIVEGTWAVISCWGLIGSLRRGRDG